jgi:GT2 family glycosyltransferase
VTTFAARHAGHHLRTFTLGFGVVGSDERAAARTVAAVLGAEHREELLTASGAAHALPDLLAAYDEPGQSLVQNHFISQLARREVTVALSGLGGDELFSAYPGHVAANLLARYDRLPAPLRAAMGQAARAAPSQRARRAAALANLGSDERAARTLLHQTDATLRHDLLAPDVRAAVDLDAPVRHVETHLERAQAHHPLNRLLYVYLKTYLPDELLRATDAMSMWSSLEVRTPFLDYRLVELAMRIPAHHKMRLTTGKLLLRDIAAATLPESSNGAKRGFALPLGHWMRSDLAEQVRDTLADAAVRRRGIFDPPAVHRVVDRCLAGDERLVPPVMMLFSFETWARRWLDGERQPAPAADAPVELRSPGCRRLSVVIVSWNTRELLRNCLASVAQHLSPIDHEVIVVDNASDDGSADMVEREFPAVRLVRGAQNAGFGPANNEAMRLARGEWLLLINSDTLLIDDSVARLVERVRTEPGLGIAHCRLEFSDGRLQHTTYRFPSVRMALLEDTGLYKLLGRRRSGHTLLAGYWEHDCERDVDWVAGAFMLLPREVFEQTGGFDERLFMYGEDMEWCQRIRDRGWRVRYFPQAKIVHHNHASSEQRYGNERVALCLRRQRDVYAQRRGRARAHVLMAIRVVGGGLRAGWYTMRARADGERGAAYREMAPHVNATFRILVGLALGRR